MTAPAQNGKRLGRVRVFRGKDLANLNSLFALDPGECGGVLVGVDDVNGDGKAELVTGGVFVG